MSHISAALAALLNRPVVVTLGDNTRLQTTFASLNGDIVLLSGGGFLSIAEIRSVFPLAEPQSCIQESFGHSHRVEQFREVPQEPYPAQLVKEQAQSHTASLQPKEESYLQKEIEIVPRIAATSQGADEQPRSILPLDTKEFLESSARTLTSKVAEFKWEHLSIPAFSSPRFPDVVLRSEERGQALTKWSKAIDFMRNRNWPQAREELIGLSGLVPAAIEPIWGAAYTASQQGDFVLALALLQHRGHLLASYPDLARAEVSLALQLGLIPSALRLLQSYVVPEIDLSSELILLSCRHGLYRKIVVLLSEEANLWVKYGEELSAYLLLNAAYDQPEEVVKHLRQQDGNLKSDSTIQFLLQHIKDRPSGAFEAAATIEAEIGARICELHDDFRDREKSVQEAVKVSVYIKMIDSARREGAYGDATSWAAQGLSIAESKHWKNRFRQLLDEIKKERPAPAPIASRIYRPTSVHSPSTQFFERPVPKSFPKINMTAEVNRRASLPLHQQAAEAADRGDLEDAIEKYRRYLDEAVKSTWESQADKALNGLAMVYNRQGQREKAIRVMLAYRQHVKAPMRFHNQLATMYYLTGNFTEAAEHFTLAADLATVNLERQKALRNAHNSRERANQGAAAYNSHSGPPARDEIAEELAREYLEWDLNAPVRMREITHELDSFLEPDIERLLKSGAELVGIDRARVAREDYDYDTVIRLEKRAGANEKTQGVKSQYLASALNLIYQNNWHLKADGVEKLNPARLQTLFAASLGDDAAAQNRNAVAREYYACVLERHPRANLALEKVRNYIRTFTGERFDTGEEKRKFERFRNIIESSQPEGQDTRAAAIWGVLHLAGLSIPSYNAVLKAIEPVQDSLARAIPCVLQGITESPSFRSLFDAAVLFVREQRRRVEDQFYRFGTVDGGAQALAAYCEAFVDLETFLPDNLLDFGREGRVLRWRSGLVAHLRQYLSATSPAEKELRYEQARSQIELARQEIIDHPSRFARRTLSPILETWASALREHYENWEQTVVPELSVQFMQSLAKAGAYEVELLISNAPHSRTAHEVRLELELLGWKAQPLSYTEGRSLEGGREEPQSWLIKQVEGEDIAGSVPGTAKINHLDRHGLQVEKLISLDIPLQPVPYQEIHNPYDPGPPEIRGDMLKGRKDLVDSLTRGLSDRHKCAFYRILGARRVGKSSILEAVLRTLRQNSSIIVTDRMDLTLGASGDQTIDWVLQEWAENLIKGARAIGRDLKRWTWSCRLPATVEFLDWVADEVRPVGHPVLLLDEFQAIATKFNDATLRDFVDFWKAMIERRLLSGLMSGMDSMDEWIARRGFGNQFASMKTEKVEYLSEGAARELIENPVLLPTDLPTPFEHLRGATRYTDGAVKSILSLTAASPFYLQHSCQDVIHKLNDDRNMLVTEMTVKKATLSLVERIDFNNFFENLTVFKPSSPLSDPTERGGEIEGRILSSIALATRDRPFCDIKAEIERWPRGWRDEAFSVLNSLVRREVVVANEKGLHRIRVGLFCLWLQLNPIFGSYPAPQEVA